MGDVAEGRPSRSLKVTGTDLQRSLRHGDTWAPGEFLGVSHTPYSKGTGISVPKIYWDPQRACTRYEKR